MSTEERGGGGQGFISRQVDPPPNLLPPGPPSAEDEQRGLDQREAAVSPPEEVVYESPAAAGSGVTEQEVQQGRPRNPAFRCCDFRFDDKKLWVCAAGVFLVIPFLLGIIYLLVSR